MKNKMIFFVIMVFMVSEFHFGSLSNQNMIKLKTENVEDAIAISSFILNRKGEIFLFSYKLQKALKFKSDGIYEKSFLNCGDGPGEIRRVLNVFHNPYEDLLYYPEYYSSGKGKVTIFDENGNYKGELKPSISQVHMNRINNLAFFKDGSYMVETLERVKWESAGSFFITKNECLVRTFFSDGKLKANIFRTLDPGEFSSGINQGGPSLLFVASTKVFLTPSNYIAVIKTDQNIITLFDPSDGKIYKSIILDIFKQKLSEEEFKKAKDELISGYKTTSDPRMMNMILLTQHMIKFDYKPIFKRIIPTKDYIVLTQTNKTDEMGYILQERLIIFNWIGKKVGEILIDGTIMNIENEMALIILYDHDQNELFQISPISTLFKFEQMNQLRSLNVSKKNKLK